MTWWNVLNGGFGMPWDEFGHGATPEPEEKERKTPEQLDPERLCEVASSVYYAIARNQAIREGLPPSVPLLLSPKHLPACPHRYSVRELREAEAFLLRLGVIERRQNP